jgi:hypothetical protein
MTMAIARGHPGHVDTPGIYRLGGRDLARDTGDDGRLAHLAPLVVRLEPVPAPLSVGFGGLLGVDDEEAAALGQLVHARAGREIFGVLGAAVEYDQERQRLSATPLETYSLYARVPALFVNDPTTNRPARATSGSGARTRAASRTGSRSVTGDTPPRRVPLPGPTG